VTKVLARLHERRNALGHLLRVVSAILMFWVFAIALEVLAGVQGQVIVLGGGTNSQVVEPGFLVIRDATDLDRLMEALGPDVSELSGLKPPNFEERIWIAAFLGTRTTLGYSLKVSEVNEIFGIIHIRFKEQRPAGDCMKSQTLTHPFLLVSVPRTLRGIEPELEEGADEMNCQ